VVASSTFECDVPLDDEKKMELESDEAKTQSLESINEQFENEQFMTITGADDDVDELRGQRLFASQDDEELDNDNF
jgi:hypothetical protein